MPKRYGARQPITVRLPLDLYEVLKQRNVTWLDSRNDLMVRLIRKGLEAEAAEAQALQARERSDSEPPEPHELGEQCE